MQKMEIKLKIIDGNIPDNFYDGVNVMFFSEGRIIIGCHHLVKSFFYIVRGGDESKLMFANSREKESILNTYYYNYMRIFINSDITKGTEIDIPVGLKYREARYIRRDIRFCQGNTYFCDYKYFLTIKKDLNNRFFITLKDDIEGWTTETKEIQKSFLDEWIDMFR